METHTLPQSWDRSALTKALKPLTVDGTTISFSASSWVVRPQGQDASLICGTGWTQFSYVKICTDSISKKVKLNVTPQVAM